MTDDTQTDIQVRLLPRSSRNQIVSKECDIYKIKVTSPPVDGKANAALIELLAKKLGKPRRDVEIVSGESSRLKRIRIHGLSLKEVEEKIKT
ncbi:MAG: YggU family protein [Deltaproteobacteria bacterium]|nr:YggU family protein [Deltaproteobacteria bacterium]